MKTKRIHRFALTLYSALILLTMCATVAAAQPPDGTYTGTTSQGRPISLTISGGTVTDYSISWSCGGSTGTTESEVNCNIGADGSFQCGSSACSFIPFNTRFSIGGTFSGGTVTGSFDFSFYPCVTGCNCCFRNNISYSASLPIPQLTIDDVMVTEGDAGATLCRFEVSLTPAADEVVTVNWMTVDGTADSSDYQPASGSLTFNTGETSRNIDVQVTGDVEEEPTEFFYVDLEDPVNAEIADGRGKCTIEDDDTVVPDLMTRVLDISGVESIDLLHDADNEVLTEVLGEGALMTGIGWDLSITTNGDSWLSEAMMYFDGSDQDNSGLFLRPGAGDDFTGTGSYSSEIIDLTDNGIPDIPIVSGGRLFIQFFEDVDDNANGVDAVYGSPSSITIQYLPASSEIFSDGFESGDTSAWN